MTAAWLLSWWNLIFIVPFGLAMVYLGLYTMTGLGDGDHDADADADADGGDADAHGHGDFSHDADGDVDADADTDAAGQDVHSTEMHHDAGGGGGGGAHAHASHAHASQGGHHAPHPHREPSLHETLLNLVGIGRAPMGVVLMILLMSWGIVGFAINQVLRPVVPAEWMVALASLPLAAISSMALTGGAARMVARLLPTTATTAHKRRELCGRAGEAMYEITSSFGMVAVRDRDGNHFQLPCRVSPDRGPIAKGAPVLLVRYDAEDEMFDVVPDELGLASRVKQRPLPGPAESNATTDLSKERDRVSQ